MRITNTGNVGIGCSPPQYKLHVAGDIAAEGGTVRGANAYVTGGITACSDIRYKKNIIPLSNALNNVLKLQGVNYTWRTEEFPEKHFTDDKQIGFIAQEIENIYPEVVMTDKNGYKSVDYSRLTPVLVEALKEQQKMINSLEGVISKLEEENIILKTCSADSKARIQNTESEIAKLKALIESLQKQAYMEAKR